MKKLLKVDVSFEVLYRMLIAPIRSKLLLTGIELKIFNYLSEPKSAKVIAKTIGTHPENTEAFLDALAACDLVRKKNGLYENIPISQTFLKEGSPTYLGQFFTSRLKRNNLVLNNLTNLVKKGPQSSPMKFDASSDEIWGQVAITMANYERAGIGQRIAEIISELPEFPSFQKMLDLGGGPGLIGIAIVSAHPSMKGVVFDKPAVVKIVEKFIKEYEMEDRMTVIGGDYTKDSIGEKYDLIFACESIAFIKRDIDTMMKKIRKALNPNGIFISFSGGFTDERTKPKDMILGWLSTVLIVQDMGFEQGFVADSLLRVGFKSVRSRTIDMPMGAMDMDIGRKA